MAMTERIAVPMTPEQKKQIRRRSLGENEILSAMLHELTASTARTVASVDRTLGRLEYSARRWPAIEAAARKRAMTEFGALDPALFAQIPSRG